MASFEIPRFHPLRPCCVVILSLLSFLSLCGCEAAFSVYWNAPSESCERRGIKLDLDKYEIKHNKDLKFKGAVITLFYADYRNFGAFPYIDRNGKDVNGGIPQRANMTRHLQLITSHITESLSPDFDGLAVIDWEIWRPLFDRNWGNMRIYQQKSVEFVKERFCCFFKSAFSVSSLATRSISRLDSFCC